jgi:hypothetical protein
LPELRDSGKYLQMRRCIPLLASVFGLIFQLAVLAQSPAKESPPPKIRVTLLKEAPAVDAARQAELVAWLSAFQETIYRMRIRDYMQVVDWDALIEASFAGEATQPSDAAKLKMKRALILTNERMFPIIRPVFQFQDAEIRRIDLEGDKAVIIARVHDEDDAESKVRWWLHRRGEKWMLTDFENISISVRLSSALQMGMQAAASKEGLKLENSAKFAQVGIALQDGDLDKALSLIKELEAVKLPAVLGEVFLLSKVAVLSQFDDKNEELDKALNELENIAPTSPVLLMMRTAFCYEAEDYKNTVAWGKKLGASIGHDEDTWSMMADAYLELKEDKELLATAEGWAADYPNSVDALWTLWGALPENQREARIKPLLEQLAPAEDALTEFATNASIEEDTAAFKLVLGVMQSRNLPPETVKEFQSEYQELLDAQKKASKDKK